MHPKWKYVYWLAVFSLYSLLLKTCPALFHRLTAKIAIIALTTLCVAWGSTFICEKIRWWSWDISHIEADDTNTTEEMN